MTSPVPLHIVTVEQQDPRLGRICVHDPRSRNYPGPRTAGTRRWRTTAHRIYSRATNLDPFPGQWPPTDTGSSGTAAAQAAVELGEAERYDWYFGLDHALDGLQVHTLSVGTWWYEGLFEPDPTTKIARPTGRKVGGHQWVARAYDAGASKLTIGKQLVGGACWWGSYHLFWITVDDFADLLADDGDVHHSYRAAATG